MTKETRNYFYLGLALLLYYVCWGIPQFFNKYNILTPYLNDWFFSVMYTGVAGCLFPIILRNKFKVSYFHKSCIPNKIAGLSLLALSLVFGLLFSGAVINTIKLGYTIDTIIKHILLFFPMSLGLSLFAFLIFPGVINSFNFNRIINLVITCISTSCFFFIGFFVDSTLGNIKLAFTMAFMGLFFGLSNWFIKNFWITFTGFFITMLFNTMAEDKYSNYPFLIVIVSTSISFLIILIDVIKNKGEQNYA